MLIIGHCSARLECLRGGPMLPLTIQQDVCRSPGVADPCVPRRMCRQFLPRPGTNSAPSLPYVSIQLSAVSHQRKQDEACHYSNVLQSFCPGIILFFRL